jgi:nicotinamidase/pyrazinamidase
MTDTITIGESDVLLVVDIQNDFCPGGKLAVPRGDEVVPIINRVATRFRHVVLTQDWHPPGHRSFASSHRGKRPFETVTVDYGQQILWPDHCVQGTPGAQFHDGLQIPHAELVLRKGFRPAIDSYSAFYENDRKTHTQVQAVQREIKATLSNQSTAAKQVLQNIIDVGQGPRRPSESRNGCGYCEVNLCKMGDCWTRWHSQD